MQVVFSRTLLVLLCLTGGVTAAVFAMPDLVSIGFIFLILPGLILSITPTVFLYLLIFSVLWFAASPRSTLAGGLAGLAGMAWMAIGLPDSLNDQTSRWLTEARALEKAPPGREAAPAVIELDGGRYARPDCGDLCLTLLYNHAVERVVVRAKRGSVSYRLENAAACPEVKLQGAESWLDGRSYVDLMKTVRLRMAGGECLVDVPGWQGTPGLVLTRVDEAVGTAPAHLALAPGEVRAAGLTLSAGGRVIARHTLLRPRPLRIPLMLEPRGGQELRMLGWEWSRAKTYGEKPVETAAFLERFTELDLKPLRGLDSSLLRKQIDAALADPGTPAGDAAFALVPDYLDDIPRHATREDVVRLGRLARDARFTAIRRLPLHKLQPAEKLSLLDPLVDRLDRMAAEGAWKEVGEVSGVLAEMPPGAFRRPEPRLDRWLSTAEGPVHLAPFIKRLADRGAGEGRRLMDYLLDAYVRRERKGRWKVELAEAALRGLCRLGDDAAPLLPELRAAGADGRVPATRLDDDLWRATLIALGASADEFELPKNRKWRVDLYRRSLREQADRGCERK